MTDVQDFERQLRERKAYLERALRRFERASRIFPVWGNDPIVVVGRRGRPKRALCSAFRRSNGFARRSIS